MMTWSVLSGLETVRLLGAPRILSDRYCPMESLDDLAFVLNFVLTEFWAVIRLVVSLIVRCLPAPKLGRPRSPIRIVDHRWNAGV